MLSWYKCFPTEPSPQPLIYILQNSIGSRNCLCVALCIHLLNTYVFKRFLGWLYLLSEAWWTITCELSFIEEIKIMQIDKKCLPSIGLSKLLHTFDIIFHTLNQPLSFLLLDTSLSLAGTLRQAPSLCVHACASHLLPPHSWRKSSMCEWGSWVL